MQKILDLIITIGMLGALALILIVIGLAMKDAKRPFVHDHNVAWEIRNPDGSIERGFADGCHEYFQGVKK